ncbi:DUF4364 family protein [Urinicoccus massiliensis]|uniref:DUF4364 family protein n=1 Tax=Urinicoccus massiliensis TaxID=1723382 RepID=UPI0005103397|nr:DUF4364 family protein [Urinicoccus massiliensis]KGF11679.1 hypothetical protein HMPREF1633_05225 [Tissierellia bacterium S5-A11]
MDNKAWSNLLNQKLILLYIIHKLPGKFTKTSLVDFVLSHGLMNYFLVNQYSLELVRVGLVYEQNNFLYPSQAGDQAFHLFLESLSQETTQTLDSLLEDAKTLVQEENSILANLLPNPNGTYNIVLQIIEHQAPILNIELTVSSVEEGKKMMETFKANPSQVYQDLLNSLQK